jgi:hypothetical protein
MRTTGASVTPSSSSRSATFDPSPYASSNETFDDGVGDAADPLELRENLVPGSDADRKLVAGGKAQLVDCLNVLRVGERDVEDVALQPVRERDRTLEHVRGDQCACVAGDATGAEIDEREAVECGQHSRDALARGETLFDQRLGERAPGRPPAHECEPVGRDELGRRDQVGNQLGRLVDAERCFRHGRGRARRRRRLLVVRDRAQVGVLGSISLE